MSTDDNKRLVELFNSHFEHSEIDAILDLLAEDATWWVNGKPHLFPVTGTLTKAEYGDVLRGIHASLNGGMRMEVFRMIAEGDQVAAEIRAHAETNAGRTYLNNYVMIYTIQDGRISAVREYTDLLSINEVFY